MDYDSDLINVIKILAAIIAAILVPMGGLILLFYRGSLYKLWNKLDRVYTKTRRKLNV